jgi:hypothetical protein
MQLIMTEFKVFGKLELLLFIQRREAEEDLAL